MVVRKLASLSWRLFAFISLIPLLSLLTGCEINQPVSNQAVAVQSGTVVRISPASQQIEVGQSTTLEVRIENVSGLAAAEIALQFNAAILQVQDADPAKEGIQIQPGNFPAPDFVAENNVDNATGVARYALTQLAPREPVSGSGLLASITFQGVAAGSSQLSFNVVNLATNEGQAIPYSSQGGSITVGGVEPPPPTLTPTPLPPTDTPIPGQPTPTPIPPTPVPGQPTPTPIPPTPLPGTTPIPTPPGVTPPPLPPISEGRYVVQRGDTLYSIARRYGVSVWQLAAYNNIYNMHLIYVGQVLIIPGAEPAPDGYYVVKRGDTLYSIARRHGLSVHQLAAYNNIANPHLIYVGQIIHIPPR